jgi:hypothetical protein
MEQRTCPDSWIDDVSEGNGSDLKAYGDSGPVSQITARTAALNVDAQPFVPGKNVFAKEFVPSFTQPKQPPVQVNLAPNTSSSKWRYLSMYVKQHVSCMSFCHQLHRVFGSYWYFMPCAREFCYIIKIFRN